MSRYTIHTGDCAAILQTLPANSVQCCVTSPPYYGLRDYGHDGQIGLEETPEAYVAKMVEVFREVRRLLRNDGTLWLNIGDSYAAQAGKTPQGIKPKDLIGIPWMLAFALRADGWYLRQDIIWHKPNPMPESVTDRCTKAHEYLFLLSKAERYFYDSDAIREPLSAATIERDKTPRGRSQNGGGSAESLAGFDYSREGLGNMTSNPKGRNRRSVWSITTQPFKGAHFAVMPEALVEPCILAGSKAGDTILDPFTGSGTVAVVSLREGRNFVGCELNPDYVTIAETRIAEATRQQVLV
jgi:DNA modification methylase